MPDAPCGGTFATSTPFGASLAESSPRAFGLLGEVVGAVGAGSLQVFRGCRRTLQADALAAARTDRAMRCAKTASVAQNRNERFWTISEKCSQGNLVVRGGIEPPT